MGQNAIVRAAGRKEQRCELGCRGGSVTVLDMGLHFSQHSLVVLGLPMNKHMSAQPNNTCQQSHANTGHSRVGGGVDRGGLGGGSEDSLHADGGLVAQGLGRL